MPVVDAFTVGFLVSTGVTLWWLGLKSAFWLYYCESDTYLRHMMLLLP